ncbi:BatA domain-containing protein [Novipirellula artificiosorum]|uniref:Aerotolerance regulator N-terminal domain-containing protein n=1 Tax=Novipirellula artificiosorum TaxID=2528016 RepID=A0A5C6E1G1_9BACT|nr:BatA domain-containing protein [Novipirellula artificiosorum]TWU40969.1 hypothetical protein Poly41_18040 [Novipirellula artificiosorum]
MTFLNATLIFGVLAAAAPVVLHFLARREPKKVVFPSLRFLTQRYETNRNRLKIRRWWLLALRIAAIAAVALFLARPLIHQSLSVVWMTIGLFAVLGVVLLVLASIATMRAQPASLRYTLIGLAAVVLVSALIWGATTYASGPRLSTETTAPIALSIVIDNSPTAAWKTADDDRMLRIGNLAQWIVARVPRASRIAVLDRSATPPAFALDAASAISQIEQVEPLVVTQPIESRIEAAIGLVRSSELTSRAVIVISDMSEATWKSAIQQTSLNELIESDPSVNVTLFDLGAFRGTNRRLSSVKIYDPTPPASTPVPVSTVIDLGGDVTSADVSVTAELQMFQPNPALPVVRDGVIERPTLRSVDRVSTRIRGRGSSEVLLNVPPLSVGAHHGQIRLVGEDPLTIDDVRYFTIDVLPASPVLVVGDNPDEPKRIGQTIAAPSFLDDPNAEYQVETVDYRDFAVAELSVFDAVILLDPPNDAVADPRLREVVGQGCGLLVALGPAADREQKRDELLPGRVRRWRVPTPGSFLQLPSSSHPILAPFADVEGGVPWNAFRVNQYWQLRPEERFRELASFAGTEHPAIVERIDSMEPGTDQARGRVLVVATPLPALAGDAAAWNDLFSGSEAWPAFLLVRQMADYLTQRSGETSTLLVGRPHAVAISSQPTIVSSRDAREPETTIADRDLRRFQLFPPGNASAVPIDVDRDASQVSIANIDQPGTYWLRGRDFRAGFSANVHPAATVLERIDQDQAATLLASDRIQWVTDQNEIDLSSDQDGQRVSLHSPALLLALLVFLLEQLLGNRFYRGPAKSKRVGTHQTGSEPPRLKGATTA